MSVEKMIVQGLRKTQSQTGEPATQEPNNCVREMQKGEGRVEPDASTQWAQSATEPSRTNGRSKAVRAIQEAERVHRRHSSILQELRNQSTVFFDDHHFDDPESQTDVPTTDEEELGAIDDTAVIEEEDNEAAALAGEENGTRVG